MISSIVLVHPLIPQNTGNIARISAANEIKLHLIEPLGFELSDKYMKRAGLDYWKFVSLDVHSSWEDYIRAIKPNSSSLYFFSTKGEKSLFDTSFNKDSVLVFGNESEGLPLSFHENYASQRIKIPIKQPGVRSLNLANAVAIGVYAALAQENR